MIQTKKHHTSDNHSENYKLNDNCYLHKGHCVGPAQALSLLLRALCLLVQPTMLCPSAQHRTELWPTPGREARQGEFLHCHPSYQCQPRVSGPYLKCWGPGTFWISEFLIV